ncbi:MAG: hypothetical protein KDA75_10080, partial [Planctomycetaceae bacterium]|nr:hypothetical protein [Planctomycetaceae bacterium]
LAVWTVLVPWMPPLLFAALQSVDARTLQSPGIEFLFACCVGLATLGVPHVVLSRLVAWPRRCPELADRKIETRPDWFGIALGILAASVLGAPGLGVPAMSALLTLTALTWGLTLSLSPSAVESDGQATSGGHAHRSAATRDDGEFAVRDLLLPIAAGGLAALAGRVSSQLWLTGLYCGFASLSGIASGVGLWNIFGRRSSRGRDTATESVVAGVVIAAGSLLIVGSFAGLVESALWINSRVSVTALVICLRAALCAVLCVPAGVVLACSVAAPTRDEATWRVPLGLLLAVLGWILARWCLPDVQMLSWTLAAIGSGHAILSLVNGRLRIRWTRRGLAGAAAIGGMAAAAPWLVQQFDPGISARLLFSTQVATASQTAAQADLLLALDESRLAGVTSGRESIWTQWRQRGDLLAIREDGQPQGTISLDLSVSPESPAELMAAVIPLSVHPRPDHVLVVGLGSSGTLRSCLDFPIRTLTCWEPDADLIQLVKRSIPGPASRFLDDPRLDVERINPAIATAARRARPFDVILINERQASNWRTMGLKHVEAFQRWKTQLADDGWLCVRFEFVDFGAAPLLDLTQTLAAVFPQVVVWESAPGELLLLASPQSTAPFDEKMLGRFELPQARRLLGQIGWDCSLPLSLLTVTGAELQASGQTSGRPSTAAAARAEFDLPVEIVRWGRKTAELERALLPMAKTALARCPESSERTSLQQRLADVGEQRKVIAEFPDHYWAYRKTLRERLQERPRAVIQQLSHELHPEDQKRQDYLEALGAAATSGHPTPEQLERVALYAEPFDPLVTPFAHREIARLFEQLETRLPQAELQHWLHSVYFSPGFDRSVRGATAAIELLLDHPEAMEDPLRRWDHLNALLEILKERWTLRSQQSAVSRFEAADVAETLNTAHRALDALHETAAAAGVDPEWADVRCRVLERTLIRALRSHHATQVVKLKAIEQKQAAREQSNVRTK